MSMRITDVSLAKYRVGRHIAFLSSFQLDTEKLHRYQLVKLRNGNFLVVAENNTHIEPEGQLVSPKPLRMGEYAPAEIVCVSRRDFLFDNEEEVFEEA